MTTPDALWKKHAAKVPGVLDRRPDFRFDPGHYGHHIGQPDQNPEHLFEHYDRLDDDLKAELPLKRIWMVAAQNEGQ